jgi:DNA repair exonuclease SbcCD ATPase subunit
MEDRQEKVSKYLYSPLSSQSLHLQSEVRMLEERLKNLEYLKQTYERSAREKSAELDSLSRENFDLKSQNLEKNRKIDDLSRQVNSLESNFLGIIEELRTNKLLLEQEISSKSGKIFELEHSLQEQFEKNLKLIDENQALRKEIKDREKNYEEQVETLEEKLKQLLVSQRMTEDRVNKMLKVNTPKKKKPQSNGRLSEMYKKEVALNKSLKTIISGMNKKKPDDIETRLLSSEKKIKELESALASTSKNEFSSPLQSSCKLRSSSQSLRNKKSRYG